MTFPIDGPAPDTLLRRAETAAALTTAGYRISGPSLANLASRGSGPPFKKFGKTALYRWGDALTWAEARTSRWRIGQGGCSNWPGRHRVHRPRSKRH
jgi:hypothetical protein